MKKSGVKKKTTIGLDEFKRHTGVMKEVFQDGVKIATEGFLGLKNDMVEVKETLKSHTEMIGSMKVDIEVLKTDMKVVKADIGVMKGDITTIKFDLKRKVDYDEFAKLEKRVANLEHRSPAHA